MKRHYSRLESVEERRNIKRAIWLIVGAVALSLFLFFFGLPVLVKFAGFLGNLGSSNERVEAEDITPPAPPRIDKLPDATNDESIDIKGKSEEGALVTLNLNSSKVEVVADIGGNFSHRFSLNKGENTISASAKDTSGNESQPAPTITIIFDNDPPKIEISSPSEGSSFFGNQQRQAVIEGTTEIGAYLTINGRVVSVDESGSFTFATTLGEGENNFNIKAKDKAENETETNMMLNFTP